MTATAGSEAEQEIPGNRDLPRTIPIFPLSGALLLPLGNLPLNIFEPRYLNMTRDALQSERVIGMIQPLEPEKLEPDDNPDVYRMGCAGRITAFSETEDGRFLITLTGLCRFNVIEELPIMRGYRRILADYQPYLNDRGDVPGAIDRPRLLEALRIYLDAREIAADWKAIEETHDERLVTALAMICPFSSSEKQALLEAGDLVERAELMTALIEMAMVVETEGGETLH